MSSSPIATPCLPKTTSYPPAMGKMNLKQLFNFNDEHWLTLYEGCARRSYEEELSLYDLLNEDAATGDGMEVDVDEMMAEILIG